MNAPGKWYMCSRGTSPASALDPWVEVEVEFPAVVDLLELHLRAHRGEHVKLEFVPDSLIQPK